MGLAFINKTKDSFQKSWAKGVQRLKQPDLNTVEPEELYTILVRPLNGFSASADDQYELQLNGGLIDVYLNRVRIGESLGAPPSISTVLRERGGKGFGSFCRNRGGSNLLDVVVWI